MNCKLLISPSYSSFGFSITVYLVLLIAFMIVFSSSFDGKYSIVAEPSP